MTISEMKVYEDRVVVLNLPHGEVARVKVQFVDLEHEDVIVDVLSTNRPDNYKTPIDSSAYAILASDIVSIGEAE